MVCPSPLGVLRPAKNCSTLLMVFGSPFERKLIKCCLLWCSCSCSSPPAIDVEFAIEEFPIYLCSKWLFRHAADLLRTSWKTFVSLRTSRAFPRVLLGELLAKSHGGSRLLVLNDATSSSIRSVDSQLCMRVLLAVRPKVRARSWAVSCGRSTWRESEETAEQDESEMLRLTSNLGGA